MRRAHLPTYPAVALAIVLSMFAFSCATSPARAESWGEVKQLSLEAGEGLGKVSERQLVRFAAGSDGSYYVLTGKTSSGEFELQRFNIKGELQAHTFFDRPEEEEETDKVGSEGADATLAVDSSRGRVYVLLVYERRAEQNKEEEKAEEKEEKEEEKGEKPRGSKHPVFPLDKAMTAAGSLYAFEYNAAKKELVSKESKGAVAPQLTRNDLHGQGEEPKEALLNPRGMAVDPANGDLVISGNQDEEKNEEVELKKAEKQCRAALQFVKVESGTAGEIKKLTPAARYVDQEGKVVFGEIGPGHGCGEEEEEGAGIEAAPASPVFAPDGSVLGYGEDENVGPGVGGIVWQLAPKEADEHEPGEVPMAPKELFVAQSLPAFAPVTGEQEPDTIMSMVAEPGSKTEGTLYLSGSYVPTGQPGPVVLHYNHPIAGEPSISEVGWTAGGVENGNLGPEPCDLHKVPAGPVMLGGVSIAGKRGLLALTYYQENTGAGHEQVMHKAEVVEFGEGGSTTDCPIPKVTTPAQSYHGISTNEIPLGESAEVISTIGTSSVPTAGAKSVKWTVKFNGAVLRESEEAFEHNGLHEEEEGYGFILGLEQEFNKEGTYEITDVVHSDDLADEVVQPAEADKVTVKEAKLELTPKLPEPKEVAAHEQKAKLSVEVKEDPSEAGFKIKHVVWEFGDGTKAEQSAPAETLTSPVTIEHEFGRCGTTEKTKCKIKVSVEAETAEKAVLKEATGLEITVDESASEKAAEETKHKEEVANEQAANKKKAEEKHNEEVAAEEAAKKHNEEVAAEEAAKKKADEEAAKAKNGVAGYIASFSGSSLSVSSNGSITVTITCPSGGSCDGSLTLQTASAVAVSSKHAAKKILTLASASFSLAGGSRSVTLHLSSAGKTLLSRSHGKLSAKLTIVSDGTGGQKNSVVSHIVTLRQAAKRSHG